MSWHSPLAWKAAGVEDVGVDDRSAGAGQGELVEALARRRDRPRPGADQAALEVEDRRPEVLLGALDDAPALAEAAVADLLDAGEDGVDLAEPVAHGVDPVGAGVHDHAAAAEPAVDAPAPAAHGLRVLPGRPDRPPHDRLAEEAVAEGPVDGALADGAAALLGGGCHQAPAFGGGGDLLRCLHGDADRLLDEHVDAGLQQLTAEDVVQAVGAADVGAVHLEAAVEQLVDAAEGGHLPAGGGGEAVGESLGPLLGLVHGGDDAEAVLAPLQQLLVAAQVGAGHAAAADDRQVHSLASALGHRLPFRWWVRRYKRCRVRARQGGSVCLDACRFVILAPLAAQRPGRWPGDAGPAPGERRSW